MVEQQKTVNVDQWDSDYEWVTIKLGKDQHMHFCNGNYYQAKVRYCEQFVSKNKYRWTVAFRDSTGGGLYTDGECETLLLAQELSLQHLIAADEAYFYQYSRFMKW